MAMTKSEESKALASSKDIILSIAKKYSAFGMDFDDVVQEASMGFLTGIRKWSPEGGASLRQYAARWAHKYVRVALGCNEGKLVPLEENISLDAPIADSELTLHDVLTSDTFENPEEAAERNERIQTVRDAAASFSPREASIFSGCLQGDSNEDIGVRLGLSRERVRQIKSDVVELVTKRVSRAS